MCGLLCTVYCVLYTVCCVLCCALFDFQGTRLASEKNSDNKKWNQNPPCLLEVPFVLGRLRLLSLNHP